MSVRHLSIFEAMGLHLSKDVGAGNPDDFLYGSWATWVCGVTCLAPKPGCLVENP